MHQLTIQPVLKLFATHRRTHLTPGDLAQVKEQLQRKIKNKATQKQNSALEELYFNILTETELTPGAKKIPAAEIIRRVDQVITRHEYGYLDLTHSARHPGNSFYGSKLLHQRRAKGELYDLAFYHPLARQHRRGHHERNNQFSIFYMRCERRPRRILFGNLQIDDKGKENWWNENLGRVMRRPKNIHGMMIQAAVKHALEEGLEEILFQAGDASEIAQWNRSKYCQTKVTKRNYAAITRVYEEEMARFAAGPGRVFQRPEFDNVLEVVIKSSPGVYVTRQVRPRPPCFMYQLVYFSAMKTANGGRAGNVTWHAMSTCVHALKKDLPTQTVHARLEQMIKDLAGYTSPTHARAAQITHLNRLIQRENLRTAPNLDMADFMKIMEDYLVRWGHDKVLLEYFKGIKKIELQGPRPNTLGGYIYYNVRKYHNNRTYYQKDCFRPEIGKTYTAPKKNKHNVNFSQITGKLTRGHIHNWYETVIPAQLKRFGLGCKKIKISTIKYDKKHIAHAWKIVSGLEEFKKRPLVLF